MGVRELRDHLSAYLERVKAGEAITVTEHGRPIATIVPTMPLGQRCSSWRRRAGSRSRRARAALGDFPQVRYDGSIQDLMDEIRGRVIAYLEGRRF